jgi:hypothetical protein
MRRYKKLFANLIRDHAAGKCKIYNVDETEIDKLDNSNTVIAFGQKNTITAQNKYNKFGILGMNYDDLVVSALYDDHNLPFDLIVTEWYEKNSMPLNYNTPIYYLKKNITIDFEKTSKRFVDNYNDRHEFHRNSYKKDYKRFAIYKDLAELNNDVASELFENKLKIFIKNYMENVISKEEFRKLLIAEFNRDPKTVIKNSFFKHAVFYIEAK